MKPQAMIIANEEGRKLFRIRPDSYATHCWRVDVFCGFHNGAQLYFTHDELYSTKEGAVADIELQYHYKITEAT